MFWNRLAWQTIRKRLNIFQFSVDIWHLSEIHARGTHPGGRSANWNTRSALCMCYLAWMRLPNTEQWDAPQSLNSLVLHAHLTAVETISFINLQIRKNRVDERTCLFFILLQMYQKAIHQCYICSKLWSCHAIGQLELSTGRNFSSCVRPAIKKTIPWALLVATHTSRSKSNRFEFRLQVRLGLGWNMSLIVLHEPCSLFNVQYMSLKAPFPYCQLQLSHSRLRHCIRFFCFTFHTGTQWSI